jgi:hypothetical protein
LLVIFLGIIAFLFYIEKRLTSSEKKIQQLEERKSEHEHLQNEQDK